MRRRRAAKLRRNWRFARSQFNTKNFSSDVYTRPKLGGNFIFYEKSQREYNFAVVEFYSSVFLADSYLTEATNTIYSEAISPQRSRLKSVFVSSRGTLQRKQHIILFL